MLHTGRTLRFGYGTVAGETRLFTMTDPLSRTVQYRYTSNGYLQTVTDTLGLTTRYEYSTTTPKRLTKVWNPGNSPVVPQVVNTYDTMGRVETQVEASRRTIGYAYSWQPNAVSAYVGFFPARPCASSSYN